MKKMNFTSIALRFAFMALGLFSMVVNANAQCGPEKINIYLDPTSCYATLTAADLGGGAITNVSIKKPGLPAQAITLPHSTSFDPSWIGTEFEVMYMSANGSMCFTYVRAFDRDAPVTTIPDAYVRCNELVNGKAPAPGASFFGRSLTALRMLEPRGVSGKGRLVPGLYYGGTGARYFDVDDCSNFYASYTDVAGPAANCPDAYNCNSIQTIVRTWLFKDIYGNGREYKQNIYVIKPSITLPGVYSQNPHNWNDTYTTEVNDCTQSPANVGIPYIDWNCNSSYQAGEEVTDAADYCGQSITLVSTSQMQLCAGSYMVMRQWKLKKCDGTFKTIDQVINVNDKFNPLLNFKYRDFVRIPKNQCRTMGTMRIEEFVYESVVEDISTDAGNILDGGQPFHKAIKVTPLVNVGSCNQASIRMSLTVSDPRCNSYPIRLSSDDSRITFDGMSNMLLSSASTVVVRGTFTSNPGDTDPVVYIKAIDACGNEVRVKLVVVVIDNLSPTTVCEDKEITLTNAGEALLDANTLSSKTDDNCRVQRRLIRRTGTECWSDELLLTCADIGVVKVDIRIIDMMGNYTDCCVSVKVLDKSGPTCPMSPDVTAYCSDPQLSNIGSYFTRPSAYDNCETPTVTETTTPLSLNCGVGSVTRTWVFSDKAGNTATCTQTLRIANRPGFRVTRLRSQDFTCTPSLEDDKANILKSIRNLDGNGNTTCSAPVIKITEMVYMSTDYCKRIMRTYEIIDLCLYPGANPSCNPVFLATDFGGELTVQDNNGVVCWTRNLTIYDKTAPVADKIADQEVCVTDKTCAANYPTTVLTASDACGAANTAPTYLFYRWNISGNGKSIDGSGNGTGATNALTIAATATNGLANLPLGTYTLTFVVVDDCGNVGVGSPRKVVIKDCKSPFINTHDKNTALAYTNVIGQGMSVVKVAEVLNALEDNCTSLSYLTSKLKFVRASANPSNTYPASAGTEIMFNCADLTGTNPVPTQVWTIDEAGNANFNLVYITVEDNLHACSGATAQTIIAGGLKTENNQAAANVTLTATTNGTIANTVATGANGEFTFNVTQGNNYVVKAAKATTEDKYAGVTTFDIARISKHVLDIEKLTSPYQILAADVDKNGEVDGADMLHIRNFILRKSASLPAGVWRFVDKSYSFRNPSNPFGEDFPEVISLNNTKATEAANFVSVKLGDVNGNYTSNLAQAIVRNSNSLVLNVADMNLVAGNEYTVNVTADNFNAAAFQGTFAIANATIKSVKAGDLKNYSDANFGLFANELTTSWNGKATGAAQVFSVTFVANKSGKLSEVMTVGSSLTPAMANDVQGNEMTINLKFSTGKVAGGEFALYQNTPNPVANETVIGFNMPKEATAKLTIYSVEGKVVLTKNIDAQAGLNQVSINKNEINASGVLYYRLESADFSATKKMIIIE